MTISSAIINGYCLPAFSQQLPGAPTSDRPFVRAVKELPIEKLAKQIQIVGSSSKEMSPEEKQTGYEKIDILASELLLNSKDKDERRKLIVFQTYLRDQILVLKNEEQIRKHKEYLAMISSEFGEKEALAIQMEVVSLQLKLILESGRDVSKRLGEYIINLRDRLVVAQSKDITVLCQAYHSAATLALIISPEVDCKKLSEEVVLILRAKHDDRLKHDIALLESLFILDKLPGKQLNLHVDDINGTVVDLKQFSGKIVLIDFWATWCGGCRQEIPELKKIYDAYHSSGYETIAISTDEDLQLLRTFVHDHDIPWIVTKDDISKESDNCNLRKMGILKLPTKILVDRESKVIAVDVTNEQLRNYLLSEFPNIGFE